MVMVQQAHRQDRHRQSERLAKRDHSQLREDDRESRHVGQVGHSHEHRHDEYASETR
jgi:hypothetical protein